jgi:hypothetical protein
MHDWLEMTEDEWAQVLVMRRERHLPRHSPPHWEEENDNDFLAIAHHSSLKQAL